MKEASTFAIIYRGPETFTKALEICIEVENASVQDKLNTAVPTYTPVYSSGGGRDSPEQNYQKNYSKPTYGGEKGNNKWNKGKGVQRHGSNVKETRKCFNCGKTGHLKRDCWIKKEGRHEKKNQHIIKQGNQHQHNNNVEEVVEEENDINIFAHLLEHNNNQDIEEELYEENLDYQHEDLLFGYNVERKTTEIKCIKNNNQNEEDIIQINKNANNKERRLKINIIVDNNMTSNALVDTGSTISTISRNAATQLGLYTFATKTQYIRYGNVSTQQTNSKAIMKFKWENEEENSKAFLYIVEKQNEDIILGMDFMEQEDIVVHPKHRTIFRIKNEINNVDLFMEDILNKYKALIDNSKYQTVTNLPYRHKVDTGDVEPVVTRDYRRYPAENH